MNWSHTRTDRHIGSDDVFIMHVERSIVVTPSNAGVNQRRLWRGFVLSRETGHEVMTCDHQDVRYVIARCEEFAKAHRAEYERTTHLR